MPPEQWRCTQVMALGLGLPPSLEEAGRVLKLKDQKLLDGKNLIKYFSATCKNPNLLGTHKESWESFKNYCKRDVEVERSIKKALENYEMTKKEQKLWFLDQHINDFGVKFDKSLIKNAIECHNKISDRIKFEMMNLTGVKNPNSDAQIKRWLINREGINISSLCREKVSELLEKEISDEAKKVLMLRMQLSKTSVKKYEVMERAMCKDGRIRRLLQFYGASRTGRWSGKLVQVQNLPQNKMKDMDDARKLLKNGEYEALDILFESVTDVLSELIRTAFIPEEGSRFIAADFSAIEARVISYLAGEKWRMDVFKSGGKINVFDLVRIHKFGELDDKADENTPASKLPSYAAMMELVNKDDKVKLFIGMERIKSAKENYYMTEDGESANMDWLKLLETDKKGNYKPTITNVLLILENDPYLKGKIAYNEFSHMTMIRGNLPWHKLINVKRGDVYSDRDDAALRQYIERVYDITAPNKICDAVLIVEDKNKYHPIRDYIESLNWDKTPRVDAIFIDYLGAEDTKFVRAVTRKALAAAVARVFKSGIKFNYMLVLVGKQGLGKSHIVSLLGSLGILILSAQFRERKLMSSFRMPGLLKQLSFLPQGRLKRRL